MSIVRTVTMVLVCMGTVALARVPAFAQSTDGPAMTEPGTEGVSGAGQLPPGHPPVGHPPVGHPPVGQGRMSGESSQIREAQIPAEGATEDPEQPPGSVLVRVVGADGRPLPDVTVRLGALREGQRQAAREGKTGSEGSVRFERLETGTSVAYRASVDSGGAHFAAQPFQLPSNVGYRVQIVRYDTETIRANEERSFRGLLISDARVEMGFQDDRLVVIERLSFVNFSGYSLTGDEPHPVAFVTPPEGLRFGLPAGYSAFRTDEQSMGDQHLTEEQGAAVLRGSFPPTNPREPIQVVFQFRIKLEETTVDMNLSLPLPVARALVVTQAPAGLRLEVEGMEPAQERPFNGQRVLATWRERQSRDDVPLERFKIHLSGIPPVAGPERTFAAFAAMAIALSSLVFGVRRKHLASGKNLSPDELRMLRAEKQRLLTDALDLGRDHTAGEVGPETFQRRRREIATALASVLLRLGEA